MSRELRPQRVPWWFTLLLVVLVLPTAAFIPQASRLLEEAEWLGSSYVGWLYPVYVVLSAVISWLCYPDRRAIAWIMFVMILLTDTGLFLTVSLT